mmetsp:Transcript_47605/g.153344  ORF Transcript_47605/g.153344 Transcript_47605/m.153344 type:complete len:103 (+) Transcript_47605:453-761(+)
MPHPNQAGLAFKRAVPTSLDRASYAGCRLYGWMASPYTAKVRSMLSYKRLPFTDVVPSAMQLRLTVKPAVGRVDRPYSPGRSELSPYPASLPERLGGPRFTT